MILSMFPRFIIRALASHQITSLPTRPCSNYRHWRTTTNTTWHTTLVSPSEPSLDRHWQHKCTSSPPHPSQAHPIKEHPQKHRNKANTYNPSIQQLNSTITGKSKQQVSIQFGAYASFLSFFGLAQLPAATVNFTGIVDYASSMTFELITNSTVSNTSYPSTSDISVRFLFSNGSAAANPLTAYPLFGQSSTTLPWNTFVSEMNKFAIGDQATWCSQCGNSTGVCATSSSTSTSSSSSATSTGSSSGGSGISTAVAGVIGAMVTLAVILGLEALIMLLGGLRLVNKKRLSGTSSPASEPATSKI